MASDLQIYSYYERRPEESRYGFGYPVYYTKNDRTSLINLYNERLAADGRKPCIIISWFCCLEKNSADKNTVDKNNTTVARPAAFDNTAGYTCIADREVRAWQLIPKDLLARNYNGQVSPQPKVG
jgi:hypothetical protein